MSARAIMIAKLLNTAPVAGAVTNRIWPSAAPQNAPKPYILIHKPAQVNRQLVSGDAGMPQARVSIEVVAGSAGDADAIGDLIFHSLKDVTNEVVAIGSGSPGSTYIVTIVPTDLDVDDVSDNRDSFRRITDYYVEFR